MAEATPLTYLDHAASAPMRAPAIDAMMPYFAEQYANASGAHRFARQSRKAVDESRDRVAAVLGCRPNEIVFTGCGTESDNTAIFGAIRAMGGTAVCSAAEHHAVLHPVEQLGGVVVGVDAAGAIDLEQLAHVLATTDDVSVVSVMAVNNEVGTISDIEAVSTVVRRHAPNALLHTDAVQAACWLDLRTVTPHVDLLSLSAHKFGGPKGVGVLAEIGGPRVAPLMVGGGQERDRRSGTHNTGGIVGAAVALEITDAERDTEAVRLRELSSRLVKGLQSALVDVTETVSPERKVAGAAHVCVGDVESEALLFLLDEGGVCASAASACASGAMDPSHVLAAMGFDRDVALGALRLTLGHTTTADDVDRAIEVIVPAVERLRAGAAR